MPNRFHDFSPPPWGRAYPEALTYLWVLVIVTFIAEATGTVRIIVADHAAGLMVAQFTKYLRNMPVEPDIQLNLFASELVVAPTG